MKFIKRYFCGHEYIFRRVISIRKRGEVYQELEYEFKCKRCGKKITVDPYELAKRLKIANYLVTTMPERSLHNPYAWIMFEGDTYYLKDLSDKSYLKFKQFDTWGGLELHRGKHVDAVKQYYRKKFGVDLDEINEYWKLTRE